MIKILYNYYNMGVRVLHKTTFLKMFCPQRLIVGIKTHQLRKIIVLKSNNVEKSLMGLKLNVGFPKRTFALKYSKYKEVLETFSPPPPIVRLKLYLEYWFYCS